MLDLMMQAILQQNKKSKEVAVMIGAKENNDNFALNVMCVQCCRLYHKK
jgi:hypothetical protein